VPCELVPIHDMTPLVDLAGADKRVVWPEAKGRQGFRAT
jgi:hypothetical protein